MQENAAVCGKGLTRHSVRAASKYKVQALMHFVEQEGGSASGYVAWAAHHQLQVRSWAHHPAAPIWFCWALVW